MEYGSAALLPALVSLLVALKTRAVVPALAIGALTGTLIMGVYSHGLASGLPAGLFDFIQRAFLEQPAKASNAQILVLIFLIGGFVHLLDKSGAILNFSGAVTERVRSPKSAQMATWLGGLSIFFSDLGNALILGPIFRPIYDRFGLSREKLAYVIDATAAPVCVLIPFIGWGVYLSGLLEGAFGGLSPESIEVVAQQVPALVADDGTFLAFHALIALLPFQLYPLLTLLSVPVVIIGGRNLGKMAKTLPSSIPVEQTETGGSPGLVVTVLLVLMTTLGGVLIWVSLTRGAPNGADIKLAIASGYIFAILTAMVLLARDGIMSIANSFSAIKDGMGKMVNLAIIICLAWTLGDICKVMGTGEVLSAWLDGSLSPALLPALVMLIGATISFATGSSFGTFAILIPIVVPLAVSIGAPLLVTIAAAISGGIFGDHTSPISDTTLLASMGAGVDHASHVETQLPYAALIGSVALVGFIGAGFWPSGWVLFGMGIATIVVVLTVGRVMGQPETAL
jgi:Na+/H+ antiporter NhaC